MSRSRSSRRLLAAGIALAGLITLIFLPSAGRAVIKGSPHDFSSISAIAASGGCSACHIPHMGDSYAIWARTLEPYRSSLQLNGSGSRPNYLLNPTIPCYDCHDYHDGGGTVNQFPNNIPRKSDFNLGHYPQNVAFGFTKVSTGSMTEDAPGGSVSGYYENNPPNGSNFGADPGGVPLEDTGGHYFRNDPTVTANDSYDVGDKLPCRDCHDPHAWTSSRQAFIRTDWPNRGSRFVSTWLDSNWSGQASEYMANSVGIRNNSESREICIACHGIWDRNNPPADNTLVLKPVPVEFQSISTSYSSTAGQITPPTVTRLQHRATDGTACVSCHSHNAVEVSCTECHGEPPGPGSAPNYPPGFSRPYPASDDSHARHVGQQSGAAANSSSPYAFGCEVCHADGNVHSNGSINIDYDLSSIGKSNPPSFTRALSEGDRPQCGNVYCHSMGHDNTAVSGYYKTAEWAMGSLSCSGCHGNAAYDNTSPYYGMPDNTSGTHPNSHEAHVVNNGYECSVCHFGTVEGTYQTQSRAIKGTTNAFHVNGTTDVAFDPVVVPSGAYDPPTMTCQVSCHNAPPVQPPVWGASAPPNVITCEGCHGGATDVNNFSWDNVQSKIDNTSEWTTYGHGGKGVTCYGCHDQGIPHDMTPTLSGPNPFRLRTGFTCSDNNAGCHQNIPASQVVTHDNDAMAAAGYPPQRTWAWKPGCVNCHDPHGDGTNLSMIQKELYDKASFGVPAGPPPAQPTEQTSLVFTDNVTGASAAGTSYADLDSPFSSLCQECHEAANHLSFKDDTSAALLNHPSTGINPGDCSDCHKHESAFKPLWCYDCHGSPATGQYWPDGAGGIPAYVDDTAGAHDNHVLAIGRYLGYGDYRTTMYDDAQQRTICAFCHSNPGGSGHTNNGGADAGGPDRVNVYNPTDDANAYFRKFTGGSAVDNDTTSGWNYDYATLSCSNLICHNLMRTPTATFGDGSRTESINGAAFFDNVQGNWNTPPNPDSFLVWQDRNHDGTFAAKYWRVGCFICHGWYGRPRAADDTIVTSDVDETFHKMHAGRSMADHNLGSPPAAPDGNDGDSGMGFACFQCHPVSADGTINNGELGSYVQNDAGTYYGHLNGQVEIDFSTAVSGRSSEKLEVAYGGGNGAYSKGTSFAFRNGNYTTTCNNIYCHGETLSSKPTVNPGRVNPQFNAPTTYGCGSCHDADYRNDTSPGDERSNARDVGKIISNGHVKHYGKPADDWNSNPEEPDIFGPNFGMQSKSGWTGVRNDYNQSYYMGRCYACHYIVRDETIQGVKSFCNPCHGFAGTEVDIVSGRHVNGIVEFRNLADNTAAPLSTTTACNNCHSTAVVAGQTQSGTQLAKTNWSNAVYRLPCLACHNGTDPASNFADGTGPAGNAIDAPDMAGNGTGYGSEILGHSRPAGSGVYPGSGLPAADKPCAVCHDPGKPHLDGVNGTDFSSLRIDNTINGIDLTGATAVGQVCAACHQNTGGDQGNQVSTHGNTNAAFQGSTTHDASAEDFAYHCDACHEPHGLTQNGRTATSANIFMVRSAVEVRNFSVPATGADNTTTIGIVFESRTGTDSFDDGVTQGNNVCVACHTSGSRPGSGTALTNPAGDATHAGLDDYNQNEQGNNCTGCHSHNYDSATATVDGFMPLPCNDCHTYPGLPTNGAHRLSPQSHDRHVGVPSDAPPVENLGYSCSRCHYGASHNDAGIASAAQWGSVNVDNNVQVRFDSFNPAAGANNPVDTTQDSTSFNDTTNVCSNLYCHGAPPTLPDWDVASTVTGCNACHQNSALGHHSHASTSSTAALLIACEACHANRASSHPNASHVGGPDNATWTGKTAEVLFTDNATAQTYDNVAYRSKNLWSNPFTGGAPTPAYTGGGASAGPDGRNPYIDWTEGTCNSVWCHSNANPLGWKGTAGTNAYRTPTWTGNCIACHPGSVGRNCNVCHSYRSTATAMDNTTENLSKAHITHTATDRYAFTCDECHAWTVINDPPASPNTGTIINGTGHDNHVNGIKTVAFGTTLRTTTIDQSGGSYDNAAYRCYNTYCHSNGTDNVAFGAPLDNAIAWNSAAGGTCTTCHGGNAASVAPVSTGSHAKHISTYRCSACHSQTVAASSDNVMVAYDNHVNGRKNVAQGDGYTFTYTAGTCTNISCHGGNSATWGGTLACSACHVGTGDVDDFPANFWVFNGTTARIDNTEWGYSGHGRQSGTYDVSINPASAFGGTNPCLYCHDDTVTHGVSFNPFRLKDQTGVAGYGGITPAWNATCLVCHSKTTTPPGYDYPGGPGGKVASTNSRVDTAHYGSKHTTDKGGRYCYDCHDPHGDRTAGNGNIFMIHDSVAGTTDAADNVGRPTSFGTPVFTDNATGTDYAKSASPFDGICQVCHTTTNHYTSTSGDGHNSTTTCTSCHIHDDDFAPVCNACHGSIGTGQFWPVGVPGSYPNRAGAHDSHVLAISQYLYGQDLNALLADAASDTKQLTICAWCHPDPGSSRAGTGESAHSDYTAPADVHGDGRAGAAASFLQYYDGNLATPGSDNNTTATYDNTTRSCSNTRCHNNVGTPSGANDWRTPPAWSITGCESAQCHVLPASSGAHNTHYAPKNTGMGYLCSECHVVPTSLQHGNGQVNLSFAGLEATLGGGNGFYDKDNGGTLTAGDNNFKAYDNVYDRTCFNLYCHGGDNPWGGMDNTPVWDNAATGNCGACHGVYGSTYLSGSGAAMIPVITGNHRIHFRQFDGSGAEVINGGPRLNQHPGNAGGGCNACHNIDTNCTTACHELHGSAGANQPTGTHADGKVDFRNDLLIYPPGITDPYTGVDLATTPACGECHSTATVVTSTHPSPGTTGVAAAKANWDNAAYRLDCLTCHNGGDPGNSMSGGNGIGAPDAYGDGSSYGAEARGHNRPTGSGPYPLTGNPAGDQPCTACHNATLLHINHVADNTYAGNRLQDNVNGVSGITTVSVMCSACHTTAGASPATKKSVNTHGNAGYAGRLEAVFTGLACEQCHEPHGMVSVSAAPAGVNLWMINPTVTVATGTTVSPVRLFSRTGANSFNNYDPGAGNELNASLYNANAGDQLCVICHANAANPGQPMTANISGRHNAPAYTGFEAGKDCSGCHSHNQDDTLATVDGLMPLACNGCHSYPGLDNTGVNLQQMSRGHWDHVGQPLPVGSGTNNRGYECTICHFSYLHNQTGVGVGQAWPGGYFTNVNIRFDNVWNPGSPTYNGQPAGAVAAPGNGGTGVCAGLYCHGGNATRNAGWAGTDNTPSWNGTAVCGACHVAGSGFAPGNHPRHLTAAYGPGIGAFSAGGTCSEGTGCHTAYDFVPAGSHANNQGSFRTSPGDGTPVSLSTTQICANCHPTYTSVNIPDSGDTLARTQANWDNSTYYLPCITCHNGTAAGTQATADLAGTGARAAAIEGTYFASGHGLYGFPAPLECGWCHNGSLGHIGASRPVGTNPWRIGISSFSNLGRMDYYCSVDVCHGSVPPNDHAWRLEGSGSYGPETKEATDTHPTTVQAVGVDKDRWFQVPPSVHVPLFGNLLDVNYNKSGGASNYVLCVSCHDPHGVVATPLSSTVRTFSGQNTDAKGNKMLRFNYSSGSPTALCSQCHR